MTVLLNRDQVLELCDDACPKCAERWPLKWDNREKVWRHERNNVGSTSITICMASHLREKYSEVLNG
jgi:hypothetical protein